MQTNLYECEDGEDGGGGGGRCGPGGEGAQYHPRPVLHSITV